MLFVLEALTYSSHIFWGLSLVSRVYRSLLYLCGTRLNYAIIPFMAFDARVNIVARTLLAAASSSGLSAALYFWLAPLLAPRLGLISPTDSFPWWGPSTIKLIESILLSTTKLSNGTLFNFIIN